MTDAVVIGGGPSGSTVGSLLARLGYEVVILEREAFPRHRIGESMLPATMEILELTGAMDAVRAAGFPVKRGGIYSWGRTSEPWIFRFGERGIGTALQVERSRFDTILLDNAARQGVDVRTGATVTGLLSDDGRVRGVRFRGTDGGERELPASWVLDASGQAAFIANRLGTRRINQHLRNVAIYGYWHGRRAAELRELCPEATDDDRNSIFIEASPTGWVWWIPLEEETFSVGAVVGATGDGGIRRRGLAGHYRDVVTRTRFVRRLLDGCRLQDPIRVVRDWSYRSTTLAGPGFALLGDAAAFVDPILSTGVFLGTNAALALASAINTVERRLLDETTALNWYEQVYRQVYDDYEAMVRHWYFGERSQDSWFWRARRVLREDDAEFRQSFVLLASGASHSVQREFVTAAAGPVRYVSTAAAFGAMGSPAALNRLSANLALDLSASLPAGDGGVPPELELALLPDRDLTLTYALIGADGACVRLTGEQARSLADTMGVPWAGSTTGSSGA